MIRGGTSTSPFSAACRRGEGRPRQLDGAIEGDGQHRGGWTLRWGPRGDHRHGARHQGGRAAHREGVSYRSPAQASSISSSPTSPSSRSGPKASCSRSSSRRKPRVRTVAHGAGADSRAGVARHRPGRGRREALGDVDVLRVLSYLGLILESGRRCRRRAVRVDW